MKRAAGERNPWLQTIAALGRAPARVRDTIMDVEFHGRTILPRKIMTRASIFLLLVSGGAIVNIAVAWGFCRTPEWHLPHERILQHQDERDWWQRNTPDAFPRDRDLVKVMQWRRFANRHQNITTGFHHADRYQSGWPFYAMERSDWRDNFKLTFESRHLITLPPWLANRLNTSSLPLRPIWSGFAINTLFYAAILWLLVALPGALRRWRRLKRGLCPACAYPVGTSPVCTECGAALPVRDSSQPA